MLIFPGTHERDPGQLSQSTQSRLRGSKAETKVFFGVTLVLVGRLMMILVRAHDNPAHSFVFPHADRRDDVFKPYLISPAHSPSKHVSIIGRNQPIPGP